jgi:hypothetical protein
MMNSLLRALLALGVAQGHLGIARSRAAGRLEFLDQVGARLGHDQAVTFAAGKAGRLGAAGGDHYGGLASGRSNRRA